MEGPTSSTATSLSKLRLMCSYGGHILPRPNSNSFFYLGGETRIVGVHRRITSSFSSFTAHLAATLRTNQPFTVKYQLPHHGIDSLISITSDDDLLIMFDEHNRLAASPTPSRLRLFLFPAKTPRAQLPNSPTDSWFSDTLKSAKIMRRRDGFRDSGLGFVDSTRMGAQNQSSRQESVVLETSSSFGSSSSSGSSSNMPPIGIQVEEDSNVKFPLPDSILCYNGPTSAISTGIDAASIASSHVELQNNVPSASFAQVYTPVQVSGYPFYTQFAQHQHQQQQMQFVQPNFPYHYPANPIYQYHPQFTHYQTHYQPSQACPVYLVPITQNTQPYNLSIEENTIDNENPQPELATEVYEETSTPKNHHHQQQIIEVVDKAKDDDLAAYDMIYKTQPPAPFCSPQLQNMAGPSTVLLSEDLAKLHVNDAAQHLMA